jgi:hypothetical protein
MSLLKRLFGNGTKAPKVRTRVCVECGMPVSEHKEWCAIFRGYLEMKARAAGQPQA